MMISAPRKLTRIAAQWPIPTRSPSTKAAKIATRKGDTKEIAEASASGTTAIAAK